MWEKAKYKIFPAANDLAVIIVGLSKNEDT